MLRTFNVSGPCKSERHYMVSAIDRLTGIRELIEDQAYFVLHAPRQTGKTTSMLELARELTLEGRFTSAVLSVELGAPSGNDPDTAEQAILNAWTGSLTWQLPKELQPPPWPEAPATARVRAALQSWARVSTRPLVLFIDEIDSLQDRTLLTVLRQLRDGFLGRPTNFPWSLALVGMRDVRDYRFSATNQNRMGSASPFNIKDESYLLPDFTREEFSELYSQHTFATGQRFAPEAINLAFDLTQGQPWLANALARQLVEVVEPDYSKLITIAAVERAKEILIRRQDTHLDSLSERLREPRIRRIVEPMITGTTPGLLDRDDIRYVCDMGLLYQQQEGGLVVANPIYQEVIIRDLASTLQASLPRITASWLTPEGRLDEDLLLEAFLSFWRQHGEPLLQASPYHEAAPHLVLMAFLHRVVNGGGSIAREYAIGMGRMDLCLQFRDSKMGIEIKVWRDKQKDPLDAGLEQLDRYLSGLGLSRGWLMIFDQRSGLPPIAERTQRTIRQTNLGRTVCVVRA